MELTGADGSKVTLQEGVVNGVPTIRARTTDALTQEHALSMFAAVLTERGNGDVEMYATGWHRGAWEAWYKREDWDSPEGDADGQKLWVPEG